MWKPDKNKVSDKEIVGRRVFGQKIFKNPGGKHLFEWKIFYDTRFQNDLSFDRLGLNTIDEKVVKFLTSQCHEHGKQQNKKFKGWAPIKVSDLKKIKVSDPNLPNLNQLEIQPTPTTEPDNPYHADLSRDGFRENFSAERLA